MCASGNRVRWEAGNALQSRLHKPPTGMRVYNPTAIELEHTILDSRAWKGAYTPLLVGNEFPLPLRTLHRSISFAAQGVAFPDQLAGRGRESGSVKGYEELRGRASYTHQQPVIAHSVLPLPLHTMGPISLDIRERPHAPVHTVASDGAVFASRRDDPTMKHLSESYKKVSQNFLRVFEDGSGDIRGCENKSTLASGVTDVLGENLFYALFKLLRVGKRLGHLETSRSEMTREGGGALDHLDTRSLEPTLGPS
ncbi:hypothetical protein BJY52DRAFT_1417405 [Lactarius psammicola]|nr:hypothetical protein BJY52DRAFT_1417405 [Lactarius psammicola]